MVLTDIPHEDVRSATSTPAVATGVAQMLLGGRYAPITDAIGFLEADFTRVVSADLQWRASLGGYVERAIPGGLIAALDALLPLTGPLIRHAWIRASGGWTAYFDNSVNGSDPFPPVSYLARQIGCRGIMIGCREGTDRRGAAAQFILYGPEPTGWLNQVRAVAAIDEGKGSWVWDATGEVQPFEDQSRYRRRRVRDRLTPEMVRSYCESLGIRPFEDSFYGDSALMITNQNIRGPVRTESLSEARVWHGLE